MLTWVRSGDLRAWDKDDGQSLAQLRKLAPHTHSIAVRPERGRLATQLGPSKRRKG